MVYACSGLCSGVKTNEVLIRAQAWMNFKNILSDGEADTKDHIYNPIYVNV